MTITITPQVDKLQERIAYSLNNLNRAPDILKEVIKKMNSDQIKAVRSVLHEYPKRNVDGFLSELRNLRDVKDRLTSTKDMGSHIKDIDRMILNIEATLNDLKRIVSEKFSLLPEKRVDSSKGPKNSQADSNVAGVSAATEVYEPLQDLLEILKVTQNTLEDAKPDPRQEKVTDQGFYTEVKELFIKHLGEPGSFNSGPFAIVMAIIWDSIDTKSDTG